MMQIMTVQDNNKKQLKCMCRIFGNCEITILFFLWHHSNCFNSILESIYLNGLDTMNGTFTAPFCSNENVGGQLILMHASQITPSDDDMQLAIQF